MSATLCNFAYDDDELLSTSPGLSEEARAIADKLQEFLQDFASAESLNAPAIRELEDTFLDSRFENWDGYGARAVKDETFLRARDFLTQALAYFPPPTTCATPAGGLMLEWFVSPKRRFIITIGPESRFAFAGLFGSNPVHGTALDSKMIPREIAENLRRLFFC